MRLAQPQGAQQKEQRFGRGKAPGVTLRAQPVTALADYRQAHRAAPAAHLLRHRGGFAPRAIEQDNLDSFRRNVGGYRRPLRMEDPQFTSRNTDLVRGEMSLASPQVVTRGGNHAVDEVAGAAGPKLLAMVHHHVDFERARDRAFGGADAPARRKMAARTTPGGFQDNTAHAREQRRRER